jgi:hypothetical protein
MQVDCGDTEAKMKDTTQPISESSVCDASGATVWRHGAVNVPTGREEKCACCGAKFTLSPGKRGQRFCSPYCRRKSWVEQKAPLNALADLKHRVTELERRVAVIERKD